MSRETPSGSEAFRKLNPHLFQGVKGSDTLSSKITRAQFPSAFQAAVDKMNAVSDAAPKSKYRSKWEAEFHQILKARFPGVWLEYEGMTLKLATRAKYTPDFCMVETVETEDGPRARATFWEVKGHWREAARVRIKVAARLFPWAKFIAVVKQKKKDGGGWKEEVFHP